MAAEVLGSRVQHDVRSFFQGTLKHRSEVGVVDHHEDAVIGCAVRGSPLRGSADALQLHGGVGRRLQVDDAGQLAFGGMQGMVEALEAFDFRHRAAHVWQHIFEKVMRSPVKRPHKPYRSVCT